MDSVPNCSCSACGRPGHGSDDEACPRYRPPVRVVASSKSYAVLHKPDGSTMGGARSALERYARSQGWRPVYEPPPKGMRVQHGL